MAATLGQAFTSFFPQPKAPETVVEESGKSPATFPSGHTTGVTAEAFNSVVEDLVATLDKLKVPEKEKQQLLGLLGPLKAAVVQQ